jgi:hypothetical protein
VSHIGRYATRFEKNLTSMDDLVSELTNGRCEAILPEVSST